MKNNFLKYIECQNCKAEFKVINKVYVKDDIKEGNIVCTSCGTSFKITNFIPRFCKESYYNRSFGEQWNKWQIVQHDKLSKHSIFENRFKLITGLDLQSLKSKTILDMGCGNGSFLSIAKNYCKEIIAFDITSAIEVAYKHYGNQKNVYLFQGDIYDLPLKKEYFDLSYLIGVVQHTPFPKKTMELGLKYVKKNGLATIGAYEKKILYFLRPKYIWRGIFKILKFISKDHINLINKYIIFSKKIRSMVNINFVKRIIPISIPEESLKLDKEKLDEWIFLDTYDMFITKYDKPQHISSIRKIFSQNNFSLVYESKKFNSITGIKN